jgi:hypothetical protein
MVSENGVSTEGLIAALSERLSARQQSADFKHVAVMEDSQARMPFSSLEDRRPQRDPDFVLLQCEVARGGH